jgi:cytochrome c-type biogenesis protein CcmH/NrfG
LAAALRGLGSRDNKAPYLEAEKLLRQVLDQHAREPSAAFNLGVLYADYLANPAEAKAMFERYLDNAPRSDPAREDAKKALAALK